MANNKYQQFISAIKQHFIDDESVHALWVEGSYANNTFDEYSDIDIWLCADDTKVFSILEDIRQAIASVSPITYEHTLKNEGELGQRVYWVRNLPPYNYIDVNTQKKSRNIYLRRGIDDAEVIFDKSSIVKWVDYDKASEQEESATSNLIAMCHVLSPQIYKNMQRKRYVEAQSYYLQLLNSYVAALREDNGVYGKIEYGVKHIYDDLPEALLEEVERMYFAQKDDISKYLVVIEEYLKDKS